MPRNSRLGGGCVDDDDESKSLSVRLLFATKVLTVLGSHNSLLFSQNLYASQVAPCCQEPMSAPFSSRLFVNGLVWQWYQDSSGYPGDEKEWDGDAKLGWFLVQHGIFTDVGEGQVSE